jgi:pimeloyl-ACP methyl ester carboxylesterase
MEKAVPGQPPSLDAAAEVQESKGLGGMLAWLIRAFRTGRWLNWAKTGIVSLTLVGFVVRFNMRGALDQAAPALSSMSEYLSAGRNRTEMIGELARLIDALDECPPSGVEYRKIHLFGYSFGSVVVLDALFQQETEVSPRFGRIDTLVTVGSPFDFIRTFWPDYFTDRRALPGAPGRWINVYSEIDVLGSNFLDEPSWKDRRRHRRATPAERARIEREWAETLAQGVDLREGGSRRPSEGDNVAFGAAQGTGLTVLSWLKLTGFRVHANYWDRESPAAVSCFDPVITRLYAGDTAVPALA